jgi:signal transduction histidine kinase
MTRRGSAKFTFDASGPASDNGHGFAASLAHEIKNPLQSVLNLLHLLESEVKTPKAFNYLDLLEQELLRMSQIVYGELDEFRSSTKKTEKIEVAELAASVLEVYRVNFQAKQISISARFQEVAIRGYSADLRQVVSNLLLNALDAMSARGKLGIRTSAVHEWNGARRPGTRLIIADNGCGLGEVQFAELFDHSFTTKGQAGTGVGLMRVKDIVTQHHGTITVRSTTRLGRSGTVFSVFLPLKMS